MAKNFLLILGMTIVSCVCFGQTTKPKLDELKNDPKTTANAAKADVQLSDKKSVVDGPAAKTLFLKKRQPSPKKRKRLQRRSS